MHTVSQKRTLSWKLGAERLCDREEVNKEDGRMFFCLTENECVRVCQLRIETRNSMTHLGVNLHTCEECMSRVQGDVSCHMGREFESSNHIAEGLSILAWV